MVVWDVTSAGDSTSLLADEIKHLSKSERQDFLREASLPVVIPNHALAIKRTLVFLGTN